MSQLNLGDIIATRRLTSVGKLARHVTVRVGRPRRVGVGEWACPVQFTGLPEAQQISGRGVDSCQALVDALQGVHYALERSGMRLSWAAGVEGETGFPRCVPYGFGLVLAARINAFIDRELGRFVQAAKRRVKANTGRSRRRSPSNRPLERTGSAGRSTPKR
jgi:hypothetical protein